jgi:hypothetical protein
LRQILPRIRAAAQRWHGTDNMNRRRPIAALALGLFMVITVSAQPSSPEQMAIEAYRLAIRSAEAGRGTRPIEFAFSALGSMRDALMRVRNGRTVLEDLTDVQFTRLQQLPGAIVNRDEVLLVEPNPDYFTRLATARGDRADRAFASALKATYPESVWPVYSEQQTDIGGCTRFGSLDLVKIYRGWSDFQRRFPGRYVARADKEIDAVTERFTQSTCACGDLLAVERELQEFLRAFPLSSAAGTIERRLQALRTGRSNVRPHCTAG